MDKRFLVPIKLTEYQHLRSIWAELEDADIAYYKLDTSQLLKHIGKRYPELREWLIETPDEHYEWGVNHQAWVLDTPFKGDVFLHLLNGMLPGNDVITNIPRSVIHHSPSGHSWGYLGSGPHDLALDILCQFFPLKKGENGVSCYIGSCHPIAWELHYPFTREVIALLESGSGHQIPKTNILNWLEAKQVTPINKFNDKS